MDVPNSLIELVFQYLSWNERSRAARVCRKWLSVFHSPVLWRKIIFKPPVQKYTKLQYDIRCYRISCCLREIGSYIRSYRFMKSEDIFLLHRTLCLVAKFLEYSSQKHEVNFNVCEETSGNEDIANLKFKCRLVSSNVSRYQVNDSDEDSFGVGSNLSFADGDPDVESTLKFVLGSQHSDINDVDSELSSQEEDVENISSDLSQFRSSSISTPSNIVLSPINRRPYFRSKSVQMPVIKRRTRRKYFRIVLNFELEFYCEVDELRGFAYGTGGALLSTIRRVVRQLVKLQRLKFVDLFLIPSDARELVLELSHASQNLSDLNLVHLHKPYIDIMAALFNDNTIIVHTVMHQPHLHALAANSSESGFDDDWYLWDPRWLNARPNRFETNPLADLAHLFPNLKCLTLSPTQLTGPMLLRLLFKSKLHKLCLVQTDLTFYTISSPNRLGPEYQTNSVLFDEYFVQESASANDLSNQNIPFDLNDPITGDLIDWGEDVPHLRKDHQRSQSHWKPITPKMWQVALTLSPELLIHLELKLIENVISGSAYSILTNRRSVLDLLLSYWPVGPAPVDSIMLMLTGEVNFLNNLLHMQNRIIQTTYFNTLTSIIIYFEYFPRNFNLSDEYQSDEDILAIDNPLIDLVTNCPNIKLLGLGGSTPYVHILTILMLCRKMSSTTTHHGLNILFKLILQQDCCMFNGTCSANNIPDSISSWYSTMVLESANSNKSIIRVAECCICAALDQSRWHFVTDSEFSSQLQHKFI